MTNQYPGDVIDQVAGGATGAVKGVLRSVKSGIQGAGEQVQSALDGPAHALGLRSSPLRIVDAPIKGVVGAVENFVSRGIIESVEEVGSGITSGVDEIPKTLMSIGEGRGGMKGIPELPEFLPKLPRGRR